MAIDDVEPTPKLFRVRGTVGYSYTVSDSGVYDADVDVEADNEQDARSYALDEVEGDLPIPVDATDSDFHWDGDVCVEEVEPPPPLGEDVKMRLLGVPTLFPEVYADAP